MHFLFPVFLWCVLFNSQEAHAAKYLTFTAIQASDNSNISELVLREAYKKIGYQIFISPFPAKRSLLLANEGHGDGELFRIDGMEKKYQNLVKVPVAINQLDGMVMTRKVTFSVNGWDSLAPYTIAIRQGVKFSEAGTKGMKTKLHNTNMSLGRVLLGENDTDIAVIARVNGMEIIEELRRVNASHDLKLLEPPIQSYPLYHYLHKRNARLVPKLAAVLDDMTKTGRIAEIRKEYLDRKYPK